MKKRFIYFVLFALVFLSACQSGITGQAIQNGILPYHLGAILPLSGDVAFIGEEMKRGMLLGVQEINQKNEVYITITFEDDGLLEPQKAVNAAKKLLEIDTIDAGIVTMVSDAKPIASLFDEHQIPLMVLWDVTDSIRNYSSVFSIGFSTEIAGEKMASFAYHHLGLRAIGVISHSNDEWSQIISLSFKKKFESLGGKILFSDSLTSSEKDYRAALLKAKAKKVDGIFAPLIPPESLQFFRQKKELRLNQIILSGDALIPDVYLADPEATDGVYFTNIYETKNNRAMQLKQKYIAEFYDEPVAFPLVQMGYDAILVYGEAMKGPSNITLIDNLKRIRILEVSGPPIVFDEEGMAIREEKIYQLRDGEPVEIVAE